MQTDSSGLLRAIEELLCAEGWREITLDEHGDGYHVEARHDGDPRRERVAFGLGPADLDAIMRARGRQRPGR